MFIIGETDDISKKLVETTKQIMLDTISKCYPGIEYKYLGEYINERANEAGFTSVAGFCSHGVGKFMHMYPTIQHVPNNYIGKIKQNTAFTIEPMINEGKDTVIIDEDNWTIRTKDGMRSAQWEHSILITENGPEILTWFN